MSAVLPRTGPNGWPRRLGNAAGLSFEICAHGAPGRIDCKGITLNLFAANAVEAGAANLWLRRLRPGQVNAVDAVPLLGPLSPLALIEPSKALSPDCTERHFESRGHWGGLALRLRLRLAETAAAWFWHVQVHNTSSEPQTVQFVSVQDMGLAAYGSIRLNEHYVSHYVDLTSLPHPAHGWVVAARQNLAVVGEHPWALMGSLRRGVAYATDALQFDGLATRTGGRPRGIVHGLPGTRLQHEHALIAIEDEASMLAPGETADFGFFGRIEANHPEATGPADVAFVEATLALPEAGPMAPVEPAAATGGATPMRLAGNLFASAPLLDAHELESAEIEAWIGPSRRHEEHENGTLLSFFCGTETHVVLRAKELRVMRPHGHILHTNRHLLPDETALTSTVWMAGVFHSMLTQGHVSSNRFLSTSRGWLGQYRSTGLRLFVQGDAGWRQLGVPSAWSVEPQCCRWLYRHGAGLIEVLSTASPATNEMTLEVRVLKGSPLRLRAVLHVALSGDDGRASLALPLQRRGQAVFVGVPPGSDMAERFPDGGFVVAPLNESVFAHVGGDECLFDDGLSQGEPFVCIDSAEATAFSLAIRGELIDLPAAPPDPLAVPQWRVESSGAVADESARLSEMMPWLRHNALVHCLSPRGLEQYSGGGWGTRDVCQGPLEMLLALGRVEPVRELLLRVFAAQNADGDWPQWFMFFERDRQHRAGDSHGDIVFWPLLGLARYLQASGDDALLEVKLPFHAAKGTAPESATVWQHVQRALAVIAARRIAGTQLAAYGHGDWNDSLQPADPALRERLCSAWTVTLHHQMLRTLRCALQHAGHAAEAAALSQQADAVQADFQRLLVIDGVVTGYALFEAGEAPGAAPQPLLHPRDMLTGVHYSLLPMIHAITEELLSPAQAAAHLHLIKAHLTGPDGARLFDRPMPYRGGPERLFQRAESCAFFGREIGVMYMHAHLRFAEALAHLGEAGGFFDALCKAHPIGLNARVPSASHRQANCYYSSSDAAFADRYQAQHDYGRIAAGTVALDGGWRIYSSGPGIAIGLVVGAFLGLRPACYSIAFDPVMPPALSGLRTRLMLAGAEIAVHYIVGARGSGVERLLVNNNEIAFVRAANAYRLGAAVVAKADFTAALRGDGSDTLTVRVG